MNVMQQSSKAHDRSPGDWFVDIEKGMIKLPRFQRMGAWDRGRVKRVLSPAAWLPRAWAQWTRDTESVGV